MLGKWAGKWWWRCVKVGVVTHGSGFRPSHGCVFHPNSVLSCTPRVAHSPLFCVCVFPSPPSQSTDCQAGRVAATPRQLEAMIRISEALARMHLRTEVCVCCGV